MVKIQELDELPLNDRVVYLVDTEFPQYPERSWRNLLPPDFRYRGHRICIWKGVLRQPEGEENGSGTISSAPAAATSPAVKASN